MSGGACLDGEVDDRMLHLQLITRLILNARSFLHTCSLTRNCTFSPYHVTAPNYAEISLSRFPLSTFTSEQEKPQNQNKKAKQAVDNPGSGWMTRLTGYDEG